MISSKSNFLCADFSLSPNGEQQAAPASVLDLTPFKEVDPVSNWDRRYK
jgi:hypothetical protein